MAGDLRLSGHRVHGFLDEDNLGHRYHDFRETYDWIDKRFPESAVVQHNPDIFVDLPSGLYGNRQVAVSDRLYVPLFGIPPAMYRPVSSAISALFASQTVDRKDVSEVCRQFSITALVVKDTDPIFDREKELGGPHPVRLVSPALFLSQSWCGLLLLIFAIDQYPCD